MNKYYIVNSSILPATFGKVIKARQLLKSGKIKQVNEATRKTGISRGTYYKYKDYVFTSGHQRHHQKAVISFMLENQRGILSRVLNQISRVSASVLTINQNIPIHNVASVVISLDLNSMKSTIDYLLGSIRQISGTSSVHLVSIE